MACLRGSERHAALRDRRGNHELSLRQVSRGAGFAVTLHDIWAKFPGGLVRADRRPRAAYHKALVWLNGRGTAVCG